MGTSPCCSGVPWHGPHFQRGGGGCCVITVARIAEKKSQKKRRKRWPAWRLFSCTCGAHVLCTCGLAVGDYLPTLRRWTCTSAPGTHRTCCERLFSHWGRYASAR